MTRTKKAILWLAALMAGQASGFAATSGLPARLGAFALDSDIGTVRQPGSASFDAKTKSYVVVGNGDDLWAAKDAFHFVSRKAAGDIAIAATISPEAGSTEPHSKAGLMFRQSLAPDSPYADVVVHENGLVALQYRETRGGITHEIQAAHSGFGRLQVKRDGDFVLIAIADNAGRLQPIGGAVKLQLRNPYYVGLLVCSHSDTQTKTVRFSQVEITRPGHEG